jgi:hypothetical protein
MQIGDTPGPVTDVAGVPMPLPHTATQRIIERRRKHAFQRATDYAAEIAPLLSKRALIGICLATFAAGISVATAIYQLRPSAVAARPAPVERIAPAPIAAVVEIPPAREPAPLPAAPALAAPSPPVAAPSPPVAATAAPGPVARVRPAPAVRPKRPAQAATARALAPKSIAPTPVAPPARPSKKWVDPFAE